MSNIISTKKNMVVAGNTDTGFLKLLALIFMMIDHVGKLFFPQYMIFRLIGRLAFPLYSWCLVVGASYSKNLFKYMGRILIVGIISQPLYVKGLQNNWSHLNIFFTLFLALMGIKGIQYKKYGSQWLLPLTALTITSFFSVDYGWKGVLFILLLYVTKNHRKGLLSFWLAFSLFWGYGSSNILSQLPLPFASFTGKFFPFITSFFQLQSFVVFALPLVYFPSNTRVHLPKWLSYSLYPLHLFILWGLQLVF